MSGSYAFGTFRLDLERRVFTRDAQVLSLAPKTFNLLALLVRNPGRALSKRELSERPLARHVRRRGKPVLPNLPAPQGARRRRGTMDRDGPETRLSLHRGRPGGPRRGTFDTACRNGPPRRPYGAVAPRCHAGSPVGWGLRPCWSSWRMPPAHGERRPRRSRGRQRSRPPSRRIREWSMRPASRPTPARWRSPGMARPRTTSTSTSSWSDPESPCA